MSFKKKTIIILVAFVAFVAFALVGIGFASDYAKEPVPEKETLIRAGDFWFWKNQESIRLVLTKEQLDSILDSQVGTYPDLGDSSIIIKFFEEEYDIDISSKKVLVDKRVELPEEPKLKLKTMDSMLIKLGFVSENPNNIDLAIRMALTDQIIGRGPNSDLSRFGNQILIADKSIVQYYLNTEDPNVVERINERLKETSIEYYINSSNSDFVEENIAERLNVLLSNSTSKIDFERKFEAQEIIRAYAQTFDLDSEAIEKIRNLYFDRYYEEFFYTIDF